MQLKIEGFVEPDSRTGKLVAADLQRQQAISQLPPALQDELIEKAILAFHEDHDPFALEALAETIERGDQENANNLEAIIPRGKGKGYFIVRSEDLGLFDAICAGIQAAAGAGFFVINSPLSPSAIAAITGISISTFKVLRRLAQKGTIVDEVQVQVILALKKQGASSARDVANWLNKVGDVKWTERKVTHLLNTLKRVRLADGTIISLVDQTTDGKWGVCGIY